MKHLILFVFVFILFIPSANSKPIYGDIDVTGHVSTEELRLDDTNVSNELVISWDEDDTIDRDLDLSVNGADAALSIEGVNAEINQDTTDDADVTFNDITVTTPSNVYGLSHDSFANFVANEHIDWTNASDTLVTTGAGTFDDLSVSNPVNIYGLSHDSFTDYEANEHIDWTNASSALSTSSTVSASDLIATDEGELRLKEGSGGGTEHTGFKAPATLAADVIYELPAADGAAGSVLSTDSNKVLSWVAPLTNPMDSTGDMIVGGGGGAASNLDSGGASTFLFNNGANTPAWSSQTTVGVTVETLLENTNAVNGNSDSLITSQTGADAGGDAMFRVGNGTNYWYFGLDNNDSNEFAISSTETLDSAALEIDSSDNVLIPNGNLSVTGGDLGANVASPSYPLDVAESGGDWAARIVNSNASNPFGLLIDMSGYAGASGDAFRIDNSGGSIFTVDPDGDTAIVGATTVTKNSGSVEPAFKVTMNYSSGDRDLVEFESVNNDVGTVNLFNVKNSDGDRFTVDGNGAVDIAETGGNGGNVPHSCRLETNNCGGGSVTSCNLDCTTNVEIAVGGGCIVGAANLKQNRPRYNGTSPNATPIGWTCVLSAASTITTHVICCDY